MAKILIFILILTAIFTAVLFKNQNESEIDKIEIRDDYVLS